jgi:tetratricopeptide (TPR) repeat protein
VSQAFSLENKHDHLPRASLRSPWAENSHPFGVKTHRNAVRHSPQVRGSLLCLILLLLLSSASAQQPKDPPSADEQKAREAFQAGKFDDAFKSLQTATKTNPALGYPKAVMARWFLEAGLGDQARLTLEQAAAEEPNHPHVLLTNAGFALRDSRFTDTILSGTAALDAAGSPRWDAESKKRYQREARVLLLLAYDRRADHAAIRTHLTALLEDDPKNAQFRQQLGRANFHLGRPDDAFADLKLAFKDDPTLDPPELAMAQLWTAKHDFAKADDWYAKAAAGHGDSAKVHRGLGGYALDRGRVETAKLHLAAAQKIEPNAKDTKALAGLLARYTRDYATATTVFEELVKDHPSFSFATVNLALVLAEAGDANGKRRAVELADVYARQNPRQSEARAVLGYCLLKAGRADDAEKVARSAVGLGAVSPDAAYFIARVLADRGNVEDAQKLLKAAGESKDGFVHRKDAEMLLAELEKKAPKK